MENKRISFVTLSLMLFGYAVINVLHRGKTTRITSSLGMLYANDTRVKLDTANETVATRTGQLFEVTDAPPGYLAVGMNNTADIPTSELRSDKPVNNTEFTIVGMPVKAIKDNLELIEVINITSTENSFDLKQNITLSRKEIPPPQTTKNSKIVLQVINYTDYLSLEFCPEDPPSLVGQLRVNTTSVTWENLESSHPEIEQGGSWRPSNCQSRHVVAVVIPFRDRDQHLRLFLRHLTPIFQRQLLNYRIFVIEQNEGSVFNRGMLMNIGYVEALKVDSYRCFVFSDVDLLPENDKNIYGCSEQPRHLSPRVDVLKNYKLYYKDIFGGVESFLTEHYQNVNGFSNVYFGWGCEDDDLYRRIVRKGYVLSRPTFALAKYKMSKHTKQKRNKKRRKILDDWESRTDQDGLNSLLYNITRYELRPLYTLISVDIDQKAITDTFPALGKLR